MRPRGGPNEVVATIAGPPAASSPDCHGVCRTREHAGDVIGCGDVDRRLVLSGPSSSILSPMVFTSRVACLLSSSDGPGAFGFSTPLNMTLYRSSLTSGISIPSRPEPAEEREGGGAETTGQASATGGTCCGIGPGAVTSTCGIVGGRIRKGVCFVIFFPAMVLLLAGATFPPARGAVADVVLRLGSTTPPAVAGSAFFRLPNKPKSLLLCVFVRCSAGSGVCCTGAGEWLLWITVFERVSHPA